jgi:hypothetical protein
MSDREKLIARIIYHLPVLSEEELGRLAARCETMACACVAPRYGSAIAVEQVARGEAPTGWARDV